MNKVWEPFWTSLFRTESVPQINVESENESTGVAGVHGVAAVGVCER